MDATTESISHFIGLFEIATEESRLRLTYEKIERGEREPAQLGELEQLSLRLRFPHELEPYTPGLEYEPPPIIIPESIGDVPIGDLFRPMDLAPGELSLLNLFRDHPSFSLSARVAEPTMLPQLAPPSAQVTVTWQIATLLDDDLFHVARGSAFADTAGDHAVFAALAESAGSLAAFDVPAFPDNAWSDFAEEAMEAIDGPAPVHPAEGLEVWVKTGAETSGAFVDGESLEEIPEWSDLLPQHFTSGSEVDEPDLDAALNTDREPASFSALRDELESKAKTLAVDAEREMQVLAEAGDGSGDDPSVDAPDPAPSVEGAGEETARETAEAGDAAGTDGAADDTSSGAGHEIVSGGNKAINEAKIASSWLDAPVFVVQGDVTRIDAVSQVNVLVEDEVQDPTVDRSSTVQNAAQIVKVAAQQPEEESPSETLPQNWGLTRIAGDLLDVNWLQQTTYATDFDRAVVTEGCAAKYLLLGENEIVNAANFNEIGFSFDLIFVSGQMIEVSMVSQVNMLFDSDRIEGAAGNLGTVSTADNLLFNGASLKTTGIDQVVEMEPLFREAAEDFAAGLETLPSEVLHDSLFAGVDFLRVLQIDGDFIKANVIEQTNMIGDADRIRLEMDGMREKLEAEIVAGSNALINSASIETFGLDSRIMAGGQVYEDAMLYQAELIETQAAPTGVGMAPLVNEALAFLADGMSGSDEAEDRSGFASEPPAFEPDVMQTMLA